MIRFVCRTVLMLVAAMDAATAQAAGNGFPVPALDDSLRASKELQTVVLAGGCFWGMEEVFQHVRGVSDVVSGYAGGSARTAKYDLVSTGTTGHAESVKITYDASAVTLGGCCRSTFPSRTIRRRRTAGARTSDRSTARPFFSATNASSR
jgi:hypothetical protein